MAGNLNEVNLMGHLGKDPEMRMVGAYPVTNISIAIKSRKKNKEGGWEDKVKWIDIVSWGKLAESMEKHLSRGSNVMIKGELETKQWTQEDGQKREKLQVRAISFQPLSWPKEKDNTQKPVQPLQKKDGKKDDQNHFFGDRPYDFQAEQDGPSPEDDQLPF